MAVSATVHHNKVRKKDSSRAYQKRKRLKMDTSNSFISTGQTSPVAAFVLDATKVDLKSVTAEDWVVIMEHIVTKCKPHLKYFPGFRQIFWYLNGRSEETFSETSPDRISFPTGFDEHSRCLALASNIIKYWHGEAKHLNRGDLFENKCLFLTDAGKLVLLHEKWERFTTKEARVMWEKSEYKKVFEFARFRFAERDDLVTFFSHLDAKIMGRGGQILQWLHKLLKEENEKKRERLSASENLEDFIDCTISRFLYVSPLSNPPW